MRKMPKWQPPTNLDEVLEEGDGYWEDERWAPLHLTVMSGTELEGRDIPIAWQMEFDPFDDEFEAANARLDELDIEPDGYGWGEFIQKTLRKTNPGLSKRLQLGDCESETCVIWVESAEDCRNLLETTWNLIFKK